MKRLVWPRGLPVAAGRAGALAGRTAGTGDRAGGRVLRDREGVARLRPGLDDVAGAGQRGQLDLAGGRRGRGEGEARGRVRHDAAGGRAAVDVRVLVGEARLDLRDGVTSVGLGRGVVALVALAEEGRQGDGGEDADDQDDDEKLDQGEARLVIAQLAQHFDPPGSRCGWRTSSTRASGFGSSASSIWRSVALRPALTSGLPLASEGIWPSLRSVHRSGPHSL